MLDDGEVEGLTRDNIYAFCFECPQNTTRPETYVKGDKYKNIVSVVNPIDIVTKVAMSKFGFQKIWNRLSVAKCKSIFWLCGCKTQNDGTI